MSVIRMKGLDGIDMADIPSDGSIPTTWTHIGVTYRDEATLTEDDPTETNHLSNENDDPEESDIVGGAKKLSFNLIDYDPDNLVKFMGGTATGTAPDKAWEAPAQKDKIEKAFRVRSKNGQYLIFPRVSFWAKVDYKLAPSGIAKVLVVGTVMTPAGAGVPPMKKGKLA